MKRSAQVAVLVMATTTAGASAYSLMPREDCAPGSQMGALNAPASSSCRSGSSSGGHGSRAFWGSWRGGDAGSATPAGNSAGTQRGGFGGFARSIGAHFASFGG
jgi:hypothetical protein